jgi:hypothetical protein
MAKVKISKDGGVHDFKTVNYNDKKQLEANVVCSKCGIKGIQTKGDSFVVVKKTKSVEKFIDNCNEGQSGVETAKVEELGTKFQTMEMRLPCKFSDDELKDFGKKLSACYFELGRTETEKKQVVSEYKAKTDAIDNEISELSTKIKDSQEDREIECQVQFHFPQLHMKTVTRLDVNEVIAEIPMDDEDYTLFNQPQDEQNEAF